MISTTRRWLRRHRNKFVIGFGAVGLGYLAGQYLIGKIAETRERMRAERVAKENLRRRFNQNQEDCGLTVLGLLPTAADAIIEDIPVERITRELQQQRADRLGKSAGASALSEPSPSELSSSASASASVSGEDGKSLASFQTDSFVHAVQTDSSTGAEIGARPAPRKSKAMLWSELKIASITRMLTLIYTLAHLILFTRIQLNLLGRRSYVASVVAMASSSSRASSFDNLAPINLENDEDAKLDRLSGNGFETNRNFLAFSWWLLHRGWRDLKHRVEAAVKEVFGPINPREEISFEQIANLILETRRKIEGATQQDRRTQNWLPYLLPPQDQEIYVLQESGVLNGSNSSSPDEQQLPSSHSSPDLVSVPQAGSVTQVSSSPPTSPQPPSASTDFSISPPLRRLLDEAADLVESPNATHVLTCVLDALFSQLTDGAIRSQAYSAQPSSQSQQRVQDVSEGQDKARLANILAVMTRQAHIIAGGGVENAYSRVAEAVRELESFAAAIFASHYEYELQGMGIDLDTGAPAGQERQQQRQQRQQEQETASGPREEPQRAGFVNSTWGMFESVWRTVSG